MLMLFHTNLAQDLKLSFYCSFQSILREEITIVGTRKWITLDDFVLPTAAPLRFISKSMSENGKYRKFERHEDTMEIEENDYQHVLMWKEFARLIASGKHAEEYVQTSLWNQRVMDALLCSIQQGGIVVDIKADC